jgi:hypothetical protein
MFDPDLSRAERIAQATGATFDPRTIAEKSQVELETEIRLSAEELRCAAEMAGSDVDDAEAVGDAPIALPGEHLAHDRHPFPEIAPSCCVKHRLSGTVHMIAEVDKLACGRRITCNMVPLGDSFGVPGQMEFCEQCRAVTPLSNEKGMEGQVKQSCHSVAKSLPPWLAENQGDPKNVRYNNSF